MWDPTESCILAACKGDYSTCKLPSGGSEWSRPDWICWDLWILSTKRTRVSLIRHCALINHNLLWTLTILDGNRAVDWCGFFTSLLAWLLGSMTRKLVCADCRLSLKCTNLYIYVWRPHSRIRMGRVCRVCILSYVLLSVCIWDMAVRSGMAGPTRSLILNMKIHEKYIGY